MPESVSKISGVLFLIWIRDEKYINEIQTWYIYKLAQISLIEKNNLKLLISHNLTIDTDFLLMGVYRKMLHILYCTRGK